MLIVKIFVNDIQIHEETARRVSSLSPGRDLYTYELKNGKHLRHWYSEGALVLASKIIEKAMSEKGKGMRKKKDFKKSWESYFKSGVKKYKWDEPKGLFKPDYTTLDKHLYKAFLSGLFGKKKKGEAGG